MMVLPQAVPDWWNFRSFSPTEFPEPVELAEPRLFVALQALRDLLGVAIHPSRAGGALARTSGSVTSQHYAGPMPDGTPSKSRACDIFPACDPWTAWSAAVAMPCWGGIGVYWDTRGNDGKPRWMMHADLRAVPLGALRTLWWREAGRYHYVRSPADLDRLVEMLKRGGP